MRFATSLAAVLTLFSAMAARADLIVGAPNTVPPPYPAAFYVVNPILSREAAAQFTLLGSFDVSQIDVTSYSEGSATYHFSLQNALTGSPTVFFSGDVTTVGNAVAEKETLTVNSILGPGTYYLVDTTTDNIPGGWFLSDGTLVSNGGTATNGAWISTDLGTTWTLHTPANSPTYAVYGAAISAVPEPASYLLLASVIGFTVLAIRRGIF